MMYVALGVVGFGAFLLLCKLLWSGQRPSKNTRIILIASLVLVGVLGVLVMLSRMPWFVAAVTMLVPFLRVIGSLIRTTVSIVLLRHIQTLFRNIPGFGPSTFNPHTAPPHNADSKTQTTELSMKLNHQTGTMTGTVLVGKFEGCDLESLSDEDLLKVYQTLREEESKRLLEAYVARHRPHLSETTNETNDQPDGEGMSLKRAADILGIDITATKDEIVSAHRRLMDKLHPDKGGSSYLAAELNAAKKVMLDATG